MLRPRLSPATIALAALALSILPPLPTAAHDACVREQEFLVTAYYSPLPNQQRYYLGSYEEDIAFNGRGIAGNDGTPVYPGMIAAPAEYPFGTRIELPEISVAGTVHDRGGRIVVDEQGRHRIDLWMGEGEEGLARALAWGARKVTGKVYGVDHEDGPEESFDLAQFPAPESALARIPANPVILLGIEDLQLGDTSAEIAAIQHALKMLGYFDHDVTSMYGEVTRDALRRFQRDLGIEGAGEMADEATRLAIVAHRAMAEDLDAPMLDEEILLRGTSGKSVRILQRILALLGRYSGEIDGEYDQELMSIVYRFQAEHGVVSSLTDIGAGMVGPQTRQALLTAWREYRIAKRGGTENIAAGEMGAL